VWLSKFSAKGTRVEIRKLVKSYTKVSVGIWKSPSMWYRCDKVALRTTCIRSVILKIIKIREVWQYVGYLHYSENEDLNWAACGPRVRHSWFRWSLNWYGIYVVIWFQITNHMLVTGLFKKLSSTWEIWRLSIQLNIIYPCIPFLCLFLSWVY